MNGGRPPPPLFGVVGPTASGKTDLALALARQLPVEILVADSRQVYRGMDVGTAKPDADARASVAHHLIDLVDPDRPFTAADWVGAARELLPQIAARGRIPLVVGGTGLYVSSLVDGYDYAGGSSPETRARLAAELEVEGLPSIARRLTRLDPEAAVQLDLDNPRRVIRALERLEAGDGTRRPSAIGYAGRVALIGLSRPRDVLYRRIDERARRLFEGGLIDEVRGLLAAGFGADLEPMTGHGYREAAGYLAGDGTLERAIEVTARRTRQYAKRQLTWFGRDQRIVWLPAGEGPSDAPDLVRTARDVLDRLAAR